MAKVFVLGEQGVHIRLYTNKWKERPSSMDTSDLSLGGIDDPDGYGMGHLPLTKATFAAWRPIFLQNSTVSKDELDGYVIWKDGGGGYFGK